MAKKFHIHRFTVTSDKQSVRFNFPGNYKLIESVFVLGNQVGDQIGLKIGSKEIFPKEFHANLVAFTGNLSRNQIKYPLVKYSFPASSLVEIDYARDIRGGGAGYDVAIYFEVVE